VHEAALLVWELATEDMVCFGMYVDARDRAAMQHDSSGDGAIPFLSVFGAGDAAAGHPKLVEAFADVAKMSQQGPNELGRSLYECSMFWCNCVDGGVVAVIAAKLTERLSPQKAVEFLRPLVKEAELEQGWTENHAAFFARTARDWPKAKREKVIGSIKARWELSPEIVAAITAALLADEPEMPPEPKRGKEPPVVDPMKPKRQKHATAGPEPMKVEKPTPKAASKEGAHQSKKKRAAAKKAKAKAAKQPQPQKAAAPQEKKKGSRPEPAPAAHRMDISSEEEGGDDDDDDATEFVSMDELSDLLRVMGGGVPFAMSGRRRGGRK
jgi:hypothetical protein